MIIQAGPQEAASFTDDTSPNLQPAKKRNVSISAKVRRDNPLDWYYDLISLCRNLKGELKSTDVHAAYLNMKQYERAKMWDTLKEVQINITDPLPYQGRLQEMIKKSLKRDDAVEYIRQRAQAKDPHAMKMVEFLNNRAAESILLDAPSARLAFMVHYSQNQFAYRYGSNKQESVLRPPRFEHKIELDGFRSKKKGSIVRAVTEWTAKSASAFSEAMDSVTFNQYMMDHPLLNPVYRALRKSHAFDEGNEKSIGMMESERQAITNRLKYGGYGYWHDYYPLRPLHGKVKSQEAYYMQASDIAAGIAKYLYERGEAFAVTLHFEYVMLNGKRVSQNDAYETMLKWRQLGYYN